MAKPYGIQWLELYAGPGQPWKEQLERTSAAARPFDRGGATLAWT